jgi:hypothetical protein
MGSLLAIPPTVDITTLGITDPQALEVARALQDYGVYIVDTGGIPPDQIVIRIDPQAAAEIASRASFEAGLSLALRKLQVVTNSHANGLAPNTPGGGGAPRRPPAPPFGEINSSGRGDMHVAVARSQRPYNASATGQIRREYFPWTPVLAASIAASILARLPLRRSRHK